MDTGQLHARSTRSQSNFGFRGSRPKQSENMPTSIFRFTNQSSVFHQTQMFPPRCVSSVHSVLFIVFQCTGSVSCITNFSSNVANLSKFPKPFPVLSVSRSSSRYFGWRRCTVTLSCGPDLSNKTETKDTNLRYIVYRCTILHTSLLDSIRVQRKRKTQIIIGSLNVNAATCTQLTLDVTPLYSGATYILCHDIDGVSAKLTQGDSGSSL